jgi:hypothetical protein
LRAAVAEVAKRYVVTPVNDVGQGYRAARTAIAEAKG